MCAEAMELNRLLEKKVVVTHLTELRGRYEVGALEVIKHLLSVTEEGRVTETLVEVDDFESRAWYMLFLDNKMLATASARV